MAKPQKDTESVIQVCPKRVQFQPLSPNSEDGELLAILSGDIQPGDYDLANSSIKEGGLLTVTEDMVSIPCNISSIDGSAKNPGTRPKINLSVSLKDAAISPNTLVGLIGQSVKMVVPQGKLDLGEADNG